MVYERQGANYNQEHVQKYGDHLKRFKLMRIDLNINSTYRIVVPREITVQNSRSNFKIERFEFCY